MFLSDDELRMLTGHLTKKAQKAWLMENNFKFWENALGRLIVPRARVERRTKAVRYTSRQALKITEALESAQSFHACETGIYLLIEGDEVVYVGKTTNLFARIATHQADKKFDSIKFIRLDEKDLDTWERELIAIMLPKHNKKVLDVPQTSRPES